MSESEENTLFSSFNSDDSTITSQPAPSPACPTSLTSARHLRSDGTRELEYNSYGIPTTSSNQVNSRNAVNPQLSDSFGTVSSYSEIVANAVHTSSPVEPEPPVLNRAFPNPALDNTSTVGAEIQAILLAVSDQLDDMTPDELAALIKATVVKDNSKNLHAAISLLSDFDGTSPVEWFRSFQQTARTYGITDDAELQTMLRHSQKKAAETWMSIFDQTHEKDTPPPTPKQFLDAWKNQWLGPAKARYDAAEAKFHAAVKSPSESYIMFKLRVQRLGFDLRTTPKDDKIIRQILKGVEHNVSFHEYLSRAEPTTLEDLNTLLCKQDDLESSRNAKVREAALKAEKKALKDAGVESTGESVEKKGTNAVSFDSNSKEAESDLESSVDLKTQLKELTKQMKSILEGKTTVKVQAATVSSAPQSSSSSSYPSRQGRSKEQSYDRAPTPSHTSKSPHTKEREKAQAFRKEMRRNFQRQSHSGEIKCHRCGGPDHFARHCKAPQHKVLLTYKNTRPRNPSTESRPGSRQSFHGSRES